uniref:AAA+ ATPase domain-containing protein n=1 Tax=Timema monikensis TaxID=170555 RepID=A0A7R9E9E9_9NEOP|nr:unnamed protein product [Timema monikensis]
MDPPPDPRLEYIGSYVTKTLKLKPEKWGRLVATEELKSMVCEFLNFPEPLVLVILQNSAAQLQVATSFPLSLKSKAAYFIKKRCHPVPKEDISDHLILGDMATKPIEQLAALVDELSTSLCWGARSPPLQRRASPLQTPTSLPPNVITYWPSSSYCLSPRRCPSVRGGVRVVWDVPDTMEPCFGSGTHLVGVCCWCTTHSDSCGNLGQRQRARRSSVFVPLLSNRGNHKSWPPVVAQDVQKHVHSLKSTVYQVKGQVSGHTVLPMPVGIERVHEAESMLIKSGGEVVDLYLKSAIEGVVIKWSKQINDVLAEDSSQAFIGGQNPVPSAEVQFWNARLGNLEYIYDQLRDEKVRKMAVILEKTDNVEAPQNLIPLLTGDSLLPRETALAEAKDIVLYLKPLMKHLALLEDTDFSEVTPFLRPLLYTVCLIWAHSCYYCNSSKIIVLLRQICNLLINQSDVDEAKQRVQLSLSTLKIFRELFDEYKERLPEFFTGREPMPWTFHPNIVFERFQSFLDRLNTVQSFFNTVIEFMKLEKVEIGGLKGRILSSRIVAVFAEFNEYISVFACKTYDVLNPEDEAFVQDYVEFQARIRDLDRRLASVLCQAFDDCCNLESVFKDLCGELTWEAQLLNGAMLIEIVGSVLDRPLIKDEFTGKYKYIVEMLEVELATTQSLYTKQITTLGKYGWMPVDKNLPTVAGALRWAYQLRQRITIPVTSFRALQHPIVSSSEGQEVFKKYENILELLAQFEKEFFESWVKVVPGQCERKLKLPLLLRRASNQELALNFDPELVAILREVHYLRLMDKDNIPEEALKIYERSETFRKYTSSLNQTIQWYNKVRRTTKLVEFELVQEEVDEIDKHVEQAQTALDWNSSDLWSYIDRLHGLVHSLETRVQRTQSNVEQIRTIMSAWLKMPVFQRRDGKKDTLLCIEDRHEHTQRRYAEISTAATEIHHLLDDNLKLFGMEGEPKSPRWLAYVAFVDAIVSESLLRTIGCSLGYLTENIDPASGLAPLFEAQLELHDPDLVYVPSVDPDDPDGFISLVKGLTSDIIGMADLVPRVSTVKSDAGYKVDMEDNEDIREMKNEILEAVQRVIEEANDFSKGFETYCYLWLDDREQYMLQFLKYGRQLTNDELDLMTMEDSTAPEPSPPKMEQFREQIDNYENLYLEIEEMEPIHVFNGWFQVDLRPFRQALTNTVRKWSNMFKQHLVDHVTSSLSDLAGFIHEADEGLLQPVEEGDYERLVNVMGYLMNVKERQTSTDDMFEPLRLTIELLKFYDQELPEEVNVLLQKWSGMGDCPFLGASSSTINIKLLKAEKQEFRNAELPEQWNNTKKLSVQVKQQVAPLQAIEVSSIRNKIAAFDCRQNQYRDFFKKYPFLRFDCNDPYDLLDKTDKEIADYENQMLKIQESASLFEVNVTDFKQIKQCRKELRMLKQLWDYVAIVETSVEDWKTTPWRKIDVENMDIECKKFAKEIRAMDKEMRTWDTYTTLESTVKNMLTSLRAVGELQNPAIRERHWHQLMKSTKVRFVMDESITLSELLGLNLHECEEEVKNIVDRAVKEMSMEKTLRELDATWSRMEFEQEIHPRTNSTLLKASEELIETLEDNQVQLQNLITSKFIAHFLEEVSAWQSKLSIADQVITIWFEVQRTWMHLESIFMSSEDIRKQLPEDSDRFDRIDTEFKVRLSVILRQSPCGVVGTGLMPLCSVPADIKDLRVVMMEDIAKTPNVVEATNKTGLIRQLEVLQGELTLCEKALAEYLETKRLAFPRFYFVSSADLLDVLSNGNQPQVVARQLTKLFDSMAHLKFIPDEAGQLTKKSLGMIAKDGEYVEFDHECDCRGPTDTLHKSETFQNGNSPATLGPGIHLSVEYIPLMRLLQPIMDMSFDRSHACKARAVGEHDDDKRFVSGPQVEVWLNRLQSAMRSTIRHYFAEGMLAYEEKPREQWLFDYPAQVSLCGTQIWWCTEVNIAFSRFEEGYENALKDYQKKQISQLSTLILLLIGELTKQDRQKIMTICTIDVHSRDVVSKLIQSKVESSTAFQWQSQLRHRWDEKERDCFANICDAQFRYCHEYLGNTPRLVITPLTDRCYITLTQSLHLIMGGGPAGPAGTGKTETTKDLGRALGIMVYVFNCSEQMDYKSCGNIYKGLAQTGAWGCFDEFNRITVEVLSVVAVQVKSVQDAIRDKKQTFNFMGETINLTPTVGIFITMNPGYAGRTELPENLKALFRPCAMVVPDFELICEIMLVAEGFQEARILARKFITLYTLCKELLSKQDHYDWGLRAIKSVLVVAGSLKRGDPGRPEEEVLMRALRDFNVPKIVTDDVPVFMGLIGDLFPALDVPRKRDLEFERTVKQAASDLQLQPEDNFILKVTFSCSQGCREGQKSVQSIGVQELVVQLEELLEVRHSVFVVGNAGTGKTQVWKTLFRTYQNMKRKPVFNDLNPKAVTNDELFGIINPATREWKDGLFSVIMREQANIVGDQPKWIVLDGDIDPMWIESLNTVMDDNKILTLASNERIALTPSMRLLFEISSLRTATPATVSRAGILYINPQDLGWNPSVNLLHILRWALDGKFGNCSNEREWGGMILGGRYVTTWIENRSVPSEKSNLVILFDKYIPPCLENLRVRFKKITAVAEISHIQMLCHLLHCLLTPVNTPPDCPKEWHDIFFVFACVWAFGATMFQDQAIDYRVEFTKWWVNEFKSVKFPPQGTVFDYYIDTETKQFVAWTERLPRFNLDPDVPLQAVMVHTAETIRIRFFLDLLMEQRHPVMLVGNAGVGKTVLVNDKLASLSENYAIANVPFNFYTTSEMLQKILEKPLEKKAGRNYGPPGNKTLIYFIDDMNMPEVDSYGTVQPHTLIRQHLDYSHWYDRTKLSLKDIHKCQYVACMNPTAGSFTINPRLQRHFCVFAVSFPGVESLNTIYHSILTQHLTNPDFRLPQTIVRLSSNIVAASLSLHHKVTLLFLPTAIKSHYIFNLRDFSSIFQGLLFSTNECLSAPTDLVRLWMHETQRVYGDKLIEDKDIEAFTKIQTDIVKKSFEELDESVLMEKPNIYCHFAQGIGEPKYMPITDWKLLTNLLQDALVSYNDLVAAMNLVLFEDAMMHVCRINRILESPRGSALLVGVGGSGKQSLSRLAAFISSLEVVQIQLRKGYGIPDLKMELSGLYLKAGLKNVGIMFLMTDAQVPNEHFLVLINDLLSTGEVPDLFPDDTVENILAGVRNEVKGAGQPDTRENCWKFFIDRVRRQLKVVLCFSPVGSTLRVRARKFPAIITSTAINWFHEWPQEALISVSIRFLEELDVLPENFRHSSACFMAFVHTAVNTMSKVYLQNERRYNYTTPKSYLEQISLYSKLLRLKSLELAGKVERLENGLEKLKSTAEQVDDLKAKLAIQEIELQKKNEAADALIEIVGIETEKVSTEKAIADEEEMKVGIIAEEVTKKQQDCAEDLAKAEPALQAAQDALNTLNKANLTELKSFGSPPGAVTNVTAAVMVLLAPGGKIPKDRSWKSAKVTI